MPTTVTSIPAGCLPVAPLIEAVTDHGGLPARTDAEVVRLSRAYYRAVAQGWISARLADELCVQLLGQHPANVFGRLW